MNAERGTVEQASSSLTVACHVRAPMLLEPIDSHVETLTACESDGTIDELLLRCWPGQVTLSRDGPDPETLDRFETFDTWAQRRGVSIQPPFEIRKHTSKVTGERHERLVTPLICLALYAGDHIVGVYPHSADGETYTVEDAIATLRTGEMPTPLSDGRDRVTDPARCPECDGDVVNGQGLFTCVDCDWSGIPSTGGRYERIDATEGSSSRRIVRH